MQSLRLCATICARRSRTGGGASGGRQAHRAHTMAAPGDSRRQLTGSRGENLVGVVCNCRYAQRGGEHPLKLRLNELAPGLEHNSDALPCACRCFCGEGVQPLRGGRADTRRSARRELRPAHQRAHRRRALPRRRCLRRTASVANVKSRRQARARSALAAACAPSLPLQGLCALTCRSRRAAWRPLPRRLWLPRC